MKKLTNHDVIIKLKSGLKSDINTNVTKALATESELHYCTDTKELFIFNGTENVYIATLELASETPHSGSFTNGEGATVTVKNGIITDVS